MFFRDVLVVEIHNFLLHFLDQLLNVFIPFFAAFLYRLLGDQQKIDRVGVVAVGKRLQIVDWIN